MVSAFSCFFFFTTTIAAQGKTSLIQALRNCDKRASAIVRPLSRKYSVVTDGIEITPLSYKTTKTGEQIHLSFWDFAGKYSLGSTFLTFF